MADPGGEPLLRLLDGVEIARINDRAVAWAVGNHSSRLNDMPADLALRLVPLLTGIYTIRQIIESLLGEADPSDVVGTVTRLVDAGIVTSDPESSGNRSSAGQALHCAGASDEALSLLSRTSVALVGGSPPAAAVARELAEYELGEIVVIDNAGRAQPLARSVARLAPESHVRSVDGIDTQDALALAVEGCRVLVHADRRPPTKLSHWVNRIAIDSQRIAAFGWAEGGSCTVGPIVLPGESTCLLCWRMRTLACLDDFESSMALEEQRNAADPLSSPSVPTLPGVAAQMAGMLVVEVIKVLTAVGIPSLVGRVVELNALSGRRVEHTVLPRPDCPGCRSARDPGRRTIGSQNPARPTDPAALTEVVVDDATGIVRSLEVVRKDPAEPEKPFVLRAELANHRFRAVGTDPFVVCSGKGMTMHDANRSAIGEALERYGGYTMPPNSVRVAARSELATDSLDPSRLVLFADHQYESLAYSRWDPSAAIGWMNAVDLASHEVCAVPAMAVCLGYEHSNQSEYLFPITSNGLAAGDSLESATLAAALEVIERDAFITSWMARLPASRIDPVSAPDDTLSSICELYARRGITIELYRLPTDTPVAVVAALGIARGRDLPAAVLGLGADFDLSVACRKAALEVGQVRPALRLRLRTPKTRDRLAKLLADPGQVTDLDDHSLLFADPTMLPALGFWRQAEGAQWEPPREVRPATVEDSLAALLGSLQDVGSRMLVVDLTPPDIAALGVFTARVLLADYQPIHFGANGARLGGTRLYQFPHRLGLADSPISLGDLNLLPHPLA